MTYPMRLQKFLARSGAASRRKSEDLMTAGRVSVNDVIVTELGTKVNPAVDTVKVDGLPITLNTGHTYLMLNKPVGYLTTMDDPHGRSTVKELVCSEEHPGLFPVGRLDYDTTGLLLFTTNGELAHRLLHPRHHVTKQYLARVDGVLTEEDAVQLREGILLNDGLTLPAEVTILTPNQDPELNKHHLKHYKKLNTNERYELAKGTLPVVTTELSIALREGRKRQIKRMCAEVGHPVLELHRSSFGPLELGELEVGSWRYLSCEEQELLEQAVGYENEMANASEQTPS
ncbi:MAG: rRNA pseudouridine synthase [Coriobacteriia bacterium]|nr:rRNA pseudouridine synthase [Coriobacteriia bacterium]